MKVSVCDTCFNYDKKLTAAHYRATYGTRVEKITMDVCTEHKGPFKNCKSMDEAREIALGLAIRPVK